MEAGLARSSVRSLGGQNERDIWKTHDRIRMSTNQDV